MSDLDELKKLLATNKLVFGTNETMKKLRQGKITRVYVSSNCNQMTKRDLHNLCTLTNIPCADLAQTKDEMGVLCKKQFAISVIGAV